ncbi:hypothetical protein JKG68_27230 [Microvirga aerilata]|uniref:Uncharacterized protein n=1 Tax=Microvirga aerilata TaxID=670292 RepID=A0A936ZKC5_9HYPH|nr:hypothetical protein [Microvirga aerilata]MBL0407615.1 hypothetical protein [Microvirga aerilata]
MSYTSAAAETSWFHVRSSEELIEFCQLLDVAYVQDRTEPSRFCLSAANGEGWWPSVIEPSELFEEWPSWLPVPVECKSWAEQQSMEGAGSTSGDASEATRTWMTSPAEWPEEIEISFFDLVRTFMVPDSSLHVQSCVFDDGGYDVSTSGGVVHQDGRSTWIDFAEHLEALQMAEAA